MLLVPVPCVNQERRGERREGPMELSAVIRRLCKWGKSPPISRVGLPAPIGADWL